MNSPSIRMMSWIGRIAHAGLTAVLLAGVGCAQSPHEKLKQDAQSHWSEVRADVKVQMARQQYDSGQIDDATATLQEALSYDPEFARAYALLARCQLESGLVKAARRSADHAARTLKNDPELEAARGLIDERMGDLAGALRHYRTARRLDDETVEYLLSEAECLVGLDRQDEAVQLLDEQLSAYDNSPSINALLGEIALARGEDEKALEAFRLAMSGGATDPLVIEQYIVLAARQGACHDALQSFGVLDDPDAGTGQSMSLLRAVAECQVKLNRTESARKTLRDMVRRDPNDVETWRLMARVAVQMDDPTMMHHAAANINRLSPDDSDASIIQAYGLISQGRLAAARDVLKRFVTRNQRDVLGHCLLASVSERLGQRDAAIEQYQRALLLDPQSVWPREALDRLAAAGGGAS